MASAIYSASVAKMTITLHMHMHKDFRDLGSMQSTVYFWWIWLITRDKYVVVIIIGRTVMQNVSREDSVRKGLV